MKKYSGFTLLELMVTVALIGILLSVGMPSLKVFIQGNQLIASSNELLSALNLARSESIKLNSRVTICESSNGTSCSATGDWSNGWIVFVDANGDLVGTGEACAAINTDCLLRVQDGSGDDQLSIAGVDSNAAAITSFTFSSRGLPKAQNGSSQSGVYSVCSYDNNDKKIGERAVVLSLSGRVRISDNSAVITCQAP